MQSNILNIAITIASSSLVTFVLSIFAFKYDLKIKKANSSSEVSKSEQDRISTAEKTIDMVEKLRATMNTQFEEMQLEITNLRKELSQYISQCSKCENNKIGK